MGFHVNFKENKNKTKKQALFAIVINIPSELLGTNNDHKEEHPFCLAPWAQKKKKSLPAPESARSPQGQWPGTQCVPRLCAGGAGAAIPAGGTRHPCRRLSGRRAAGDRGTGEGDKGQRCRGAGGPRVAAQVQVASWLSTGISLPLPPSPYCW